VIGRKITSTGLLAIATAFAPAIADAACTQADLTGHWQLYMAGATPEGQSWAQCAVDISATGVIGRTDCTDSSTATAALTNGRARMEIPAACTFTAHFTLAGKTFTVVHATMAQDKLAGTGVGTRPGAAFVVTMTKIAAPQPNAAGAAAPKN
jgi:hypothetical protein